MNVILLPKEEPPTFILKDMDNIFKRIFIGGNFETKCLKCGKFVLKDRNRSIKTIISEKI